MSTPRKARPASPRIMIVRLSAIGDVIHGLPVLNALRGRFPQAMLAWVVEEPAAELLRGHQALDELITVPKGWLTKPKQVRALRGKVAAGRDPPESEPRRGP